MTMRKFSIFRKQTNSASMKLFSPSTTSRVLLGLLPLTAAFARPIKARYRHTHASYVTDLKQLNQGVEEYIERVSATDPGLLSNLAHQGQSMFPSVTDHCSLIDVISSEPPFMVVECSDSR